MLTILIAFFIFILILIIIGEIFFWIALHTKVKKREEYEQQDKITIISEDNLTLSGWILGEKKENHKWVIVIHGYKESHIQMIEVANKFVKMGRNVLNIDLRAHGESNRAFFWNGMEREKRYYKMDRIFNKTR